MVPALQALVEPAKLGDPERPLRWVSKSMDKLADAPTAMGHPISADTAAKELAKLGFSRQTNRKADEGSHHPDRDAQFEHINAKVIAAQTAGQPSIRGRKSWSATSRTAAPTTAPRETRSVSTCTISRTRRSARWCHTSMTSLPTEASSVSASPAIPPSSRWPRSAVGWSAWGASATHKTITADRGGSKWRARATVEGRAAEARRRHWPHAPHPSLPAGYIEVEPNRASPVLPHHAELARPAADRSARGGGADRRDHHQDGLEGRVRPR